MRGGQPWRLSPQLQLLPPARPPWRLGQGYAAPGVKELRAETNPASNATTLRRASPDNVSREHLLRTSQGKLHSSNGQGGGPMERPHFQVKKYINLFGGLKRAEGQSLGPMVTSSVLPPGAATATAGTRAPAMAEKMAAPDRCRTFESSNALESNSEGTWGTSRDASLQC